MMILVAVCVFENKCYEVTDVVKSLTFALICKQVLGTLRFFIDAQKAAIELTAQWTSARGSFTLKDLRPEQSRQVKHKCFNSTIYKKETILLFD